VGGLIASFIGVALITALYELVREGSRRYEASSSEYLNSLPLETDERRSWDWLGRGTAQAEKRTKTIKALFYAAQVFYSFFIMLLFMTYNGWIMIAVAVGAFIGFLAFGGSSATKSAACH